MLEGAILVNKLLLLLLLLLLLNQGDCSGGGEGLPN